jgi:eukaryotic-like serine/threonine-protein kinase
MSVEPQPDPLIGRTVADRYRIDAPVARGGMARVYRARDLRLERDVAIKVLSQPYADDPDFSGRFLAEARAAASLSHPSLVHVYDSGSDGDAHFIVMELLDRHRSLRQLVDERGPMSRDDVLRIGRELLAGLRVVHERHLVHCDVKSGNVMLGPGPAKLIDFGIARPPDEALEGATSIGSLQFMSPEQLHGEALTPASDLFSLGVVLYEALTGRLPYEGRTPEEVSAAHRAEAVRPPSAVLHGVPGRLDDAILQALRPTAASRFHSAEAMARALDAADVERVRDETTVLGIPSRSVDRTPAGSGYVPPPAPGPIPTRAPVRRAPPPRPSGREGMLRALGTLLVLGAVALVIVLVVVPLLNFDLGGDGGGSPSASVPGQATPQPGTAVVPEVVGMSTADAIEAAEAANLDWTVHCNHDESRPEGIVDQEPPAGTQVAPGSAFSLFSARISDCR